MHSLAKVGKILGKVGLSGGGGLLKSNNTIQFVGPAEGRVTTTRDHFEVYFCFKYAPYFESCQIYFKVGNQLI